MPAFEFHLREMPPGQSAVVILPPGATLADARESLVWRFGPERIEDVQEHVLSARVRGAEIET